MKRNKGGTDSPQFPITQYPSTLNRSNCNFSSFERFQFFPRPLPRSIYFDGPRQSGCLASVPRREVPKAKL